MWKLAAILAVSILASSHLAVGSLIFEEAPTREATETIDILDTTATTEQTTTFDPTSDTTLITDSSSTSTIVENTSTTTEDTSLATDPISTTEDTNTTSTEPTTTTSEATLETTLSPTDVCTANNSSGRFALENDSACTGYVFCYWKKGALVGVNMDCPSGRYFNKDTHTCQILKPTGCV